MHRHRRGPRVPVVGAWLALFGALTACGTDTPPGEGYEIVGFVVESVGNGDEGPPIAGATVHFETDTGREVETTSESNGRYRLYILSDARFGQVRASAAGFVDARETVYFDTPQRRIDLALPRLAEPAP